MPLTHGFAKRTSSEKPLYLYDDVEELQKITGVPPAGFSTKLESHVPYDNGQTRLHELVHVVAEQFPEKGNEPPVFFTQRGLPMQY